eukprot:5991115-Pyramimonas_sp.AAC.1
MRDQVRPQAPNALRRAAPGKTTKKRNAARSARDNRDARIEATSPASLHSAHAHEGKLKLHLLDHRRGVIYSGCC